MDFPVILAALLLGVIAGIVTGVLPGLHINLVAVLAAALLHGSQSLSPAAVAVFIIAMSISHVFHEFIPSIFLGASDSEAALAVLPGHRMLIAGQGRMAVMLAALGGLCGVLALVTLSPLLLPLLQPAFEATRNHIGFILAAVLGFQILRPRALRAVALNALVVVISGAFGIAVFALPNVREPLLPMFSGLFGLSSLISGLLSRFSLPCQQPESSIRIEKPSGTAGLLGLGLLSSSLMGLFPALGPAQAAMLGTAAIRRISAPSYMFLLGVIASASMLFALLTLEAFGRARNGSIAVMGTLVNVDMGSTVVLLVVAAVAAPLACLSTAVLAKVFSGLARAIRYQRLSVVVMLVITALVLMVSGVMGIAVLGIATAIGIIPLQLKTSRQALMSCLMVPVIIYYL